MTIRKDQVKKGFIYKITCTRCGKDVFYIPGKDRVKGQRKAICKDCGRSFNIASSTIIAIYKKAPLNIIIHKEEDGVSYDVKGHKIDIFILFKKYKFQCPFCFSNFFYTPHTVNPVIREATCQSCSRRIEIETNKVSVSTNDYLNQLRDAVNLIE